MSSSRETVIASQRVGAKRRPMTGSAKQSRRGPRRRKLDCFVALLLAMTAWVGLATSRLLAAEAGHFGYGKPASPAEIAGWDIDVRGDDGAGLPSGKGTVRRGAEVYAEQCAICHGTFGEGEGRFPKLVGGIATLKHDRPELTVGSYWPFAPTLWDYINRAMPMQAPHTLSADDVYALTAYILHLNDIVSSDFVADRDGLPNVKMPNRGGFIWIDPRPDTMAKPCMSACAEPADIKITSTAEGRNLTPRATGPLDTMQPK
jgi:mono/diheme cytochrome c family protein